MHFRVLWCSQTNSVLVYPESPTLYPTTVSFSYFPQYFPCISFIFNLYFSFNSMRCDAAEQIQCCVTRNIPLNILQQCISSVFPLYFLCIYTVFIQYLTCISHVFPGAVMQQNQYSAGLPGISHSISYKIVFLLYFPSTSPVFFLYFSCKSRCSDAAEWMQCWVTRNFPLNILLQCISPVCPLYFPCISLITVLRPYCGTALGLLYMLKLVTDDSCSCRYLGSVRDGGAEAGQQEQTWGEARTLANSLTHSVLHRVANSLSLCRQCRSKSSRLTIHISDIVCT